MTLNQRLGYAARGWKTFIMICGLLLTMAFGVPGAQAFDHIVTGFTQPENSIKTESGRIFVTSNGAVYQLTPSTAHEWLKTEIKNNVDQKCFFAGITEMDGYVYTVCSEDMTTPYARVRLFALEESSGTLMTEIANSGNNADLRKVGAPNGMISDGNGHLFLADQGPPLLPGALWRIQINVATDEDTGEDIITVASIINEHNFVDCKPNSVKYHDNHLYISINPTTYVGLSRLLRYELLAAPAPVTNRLINWDTRHVVYSSYLFIDDFTLVKNSIDQENGVLLAEFMGHRVILINDTDSGNNSIQHSVLFYIPTSVHLINDNDLLVTDWGYGCVYIEEVDWDDWEVTRR